MPSCMKTEGRAYETEHFMRERALHIRNLAEKADPFYQKTTPSRPCGELRKQAPAAFSGYGQAPFKPTLREKI